jgi:hypothetical protein
MFWTGLQIRGAWLKISMFQSSLARCRDDWIFDFTYAKLGWKRWSARNSVALVNQNCSSHRELLLSCCLLHCMRLINCESATLTNSYGGKVNFTIMAQSGF